MRGFTERERVRERIGGALDEMGTEKKKGSSLCQGPPPPK
jgi:hypothetical protein